MFNSTKTKQFLIVCGSVAVMLLSGCKDAGLTQFPSIACDPPPDFSCKTSIACAFKGEIDGKPYVYYVGKLNTGTKWFRVVMGSLGGEEVVSADGNFKYVRPIGIAVPQSSNNRDVLGVPLVLGGEQGTAVVCDSDINHPELSSFHLELKSGWAAMETFEVSNTDTPSASQLYWFPIPWRFITSDGIRTGATSSRLFLAAIPGATSLTSDRLCFADTGEVLSWPDEKTTQAPGPANPGEKPADGGDKVVPWSLARLIPAVNSRDSKVNFEAVPDNDQDQFVAQARYFLEQVRKRHGI